MNDIDRWVNLEGPPPEEIREMLDLLLPPVPPAVWARLDARVHAAIAADIRREERQRRMKWAGAIVALAAAFSGCTAGAWKVCRHRISLDAAPAAHFAPLTVKAVTAPTSRPGPG